MADRHGRELGFAALATLNGMEPPGAQLGYAGVVESGASLAVWRHEPDEPSHELRAIRTSGGLPIKNWPSAEELEKQRRECSDRALEERLRRKLNIRLASVMVQPLNCPSTSGGLATQCLWAAVAKLIPFFNGSFAGGFLTRRYCA